MVDFYSGCMHDQSLSPNVHTMCAKLLHNITECIMSIPDKRQGRILLLSILKTYVAGFAAIGCLSAAAINDIKSGQQFSEETLYTSVDLIRTNTSENSEKIKDLRLYLRSLVTGCKNVIYALKRCNSSLALGIGPNAQAAATAAAAKDESESAMAVDQKEPASTGASAIISNKEADLAGFELELLSSLFREGLRACRLHDVDRLKSEHADAHPDEATEPAHPKRPTLSRDAQIKLIDRECKEQIEHFANLFVTLDPAVFHELFTSQFEFAFDTMIEQCSAIASVQVLVSCEPTSPAFMSIML
ncbi:transcription-associated protein 1, partial [Linderina macrospora]